MELQMNDYGAQQHLAMVMEMNFKKMFKELSELRQRVEQINIPRPAAPPRPVEQSQQRTEFREQHVAEQPRPVEAKPADGQFSQRTGGFKPEDVSIEKFFYAGPR
jgi:hypothetical protein